MIVRGAVVRRTFAAGSKSERDAVMLVSDAGEAFVLRRRGGHPFADATLSALVGKRVACDGTVHGQTLLLDGWTVLTEDADAE